MTALARCDFQWHHSRGVYRRNIGGNDAVRIIEQVNIAPGDHIGPYVILRPLGQGGMGQVFLAEDSRLHRKVALKYVHAPSAPQATIRASLLREAEAFGRITHPHVAIVHDVIEQDGGAFIVMEYVEGETLADRLSRGRLPTSVVIEFGRQLASALAAAHSRGIIHRDLKPSNIQVTPEATVKVLDFGVAKVCELLSATATTVVAGMPVTAERTLIGTLGYMSPEQMLGQPVGPASDLFSLGVVLFEMSTGQRLFPVADVGQILERMSKTLPRAYEVDPEVPFQLSDSIAQMLEIDTAKRVQAARDVETRLGSLQQGSPAGGRVNGSVDNGALHDLRRRLILARGQSEIVRLRYELEGYLAERPHDVDGRVLKDDVERALSREIHGVSAQGRAVPTRPISRISPVWGVAGTAVILALAAWLLTSNRLWKAAGPETESVAATTTAPPTTTSISAPATPTPEETFQAHYGQAQAFIQQGDKTSARKENTAALAALPGDPRAVAQRTSINAMPETSLVITPPGFGIPPGSAPSTTGRPVIPESLSVSANPGEPEKARVSREKTALAQLDEGREALAAGRFDAAITALQSALATSGRGDYGSSVGEAAMLLREAREAKALAEAAAKQAEAVKTGEALPAEPAAALPTARPGPALSDVRLSALPGFTIDYPRKDWTIAPSIGSSLATLVHTSGEAAVAVERTALPDALANQVDDATATIEIEDWQRRRPDAGGFSHQFVDHRGTRMIVIDFNQAGSAGPEFARIYITFSGTDKYRVICTTTRPMFDKYRDTLDKIALSLYPTPSQ